MKLLEEAFKVAFHNEYFDVACAAAAALSNCYECVHVYTGDRRSTGTGTQAQPPPQGSGPTPSPALGVPSPLPYP